MKIGLAIFFGLFAILMIADLVLILKYGYEATVSATLYDFSQRFPIIPFAGGVLVGHLLWPNLHAARKEQEKK